jgi:ribonuclease HII
VIEVVVGVEHAGQAQTFAREGGRHRAGLAGIDHHRVLRALAVHEVRVVVAQTRDGDDSNPAHGCLMGRPHRRRSVAPNGRDKPLQNRPAAARPTCEEKPAMTLRIGVDENGLGPRLGPLVVTGVLAEVTEQGTKIASRKPRGRLAEVLGDSKAMLSHGDVSLGEAWARVLASRGCARRGTEPSSVAALVHGFALDDEVELRRPCPTQAAPMCWSTDGEGFEATDELVKAIARHLDALAKKGVSVRSVRSALVCNKRLNEAFDRGHSRFHVDLHAMERLVLAFREEAGADIDAVCGKVGGFGDYASVFGPLAGRLHVQLEKTRARSAYHFPGVGRIAFVMDADDSDLLVGLASMVGKYLREVLMSRIAKNLGGPDAAASGYYDPRTTSFIDATALVRKKRRIPDVCFERKTLERS